MSEPRSDKDWGKLAVESKYHLLGALRQRREGNIGLGEELYILLLELVFICVGVVLKFSLDQRQIRKHIMRWVKVSRRWVFLISGV